MANELGETVVQFASASFAPQTKNFDIDTDGVSRLILQGTGDANTTVGVLGSFDGGLTYVALAPAAVIAAVGVIVNCACSRARVQLVQATSTVAVNLAVAGVA